MTPPELPHPVGIVREDDMTTTRGPQGTNVIRHEFMSGAALFTAASANFPAQLRDERAIKGRLFPFQNGHALNSISN
jgi:hypothetical protein